MEKRLYIIRHAKSEKTGYDDDHERPLNQRGETDSKLMGKFLSAQEISIQQAYCSTAVRARGTLQIFNDFLKIPSENIVFDESLYLASMPKLVNYIEALPDSYDRIAIVGHNPGLTELCNFLCGDSLDNLPTGAVFDICIPCDEWRAVSEGIGVQNKLVTPRMLKEFLSAI